ncbi:GntR family transcriptional regulator [Lysobacter sp. HX-5-24]|uniref:GntR family transcriptional regulator n=1 Tax=Noviluteimonas gilva TaxID=2682097 RepID=A0A7C9M3X2_9GAMM|nr:GntR family transcriptional regulator [Lysobacter gilvus]
MTLYAALAADIAASIANGSLRSGDRLPSVRQLTASRHVSPATVFEAYYLLEARGLVRARPRSGYFVAQAPAHVAAEPRTLSNPDTAPRAVAITDLIYATLQATASRDVIPLGSAFPSPAASQDRAVHIHRRSSSPGSFPSSPSTRRCGRLVQGLHRRR